MALELSVLVQTYIWTVWDLVLLSSVEKTGQFYVATDISSEEAEPQLTIVEKVLQSKTSSRGQKQIIYTENISAVFWCIEDN